MAKTPLGITFVARDGQAATGVYESAGGIETFETDEPYVVHGTHYLADPLPVFDAGGPVFQDAMGSAYQALPIRGVTPPDPDPPANGVTVDGAPVTHEGAVVTHTE